MNPKTFLLCFVVLFLSASLMAQDLGRIRDRTRQRTERQIENRIERRINEGVDKTLDAIEESIDNTGKSDEAEDGSAPGTAGGEGAATQAGQAGDHAGTTQEGAATGQPTDPAQTSAGAQAGEPGQAGVADEEPAAPVLTWTAFDFVPGDVILFEDNLEGEKNGEFPSKWDLVGGVAENAVFDGENVIYFRQGSSRQGIVPLIRDNQEDYLPDAFTIEFDAYFDGGVHNQTYYVHFFDMKNQRRTMNEMRIYVGKITYDRNTGEYPGLRRSHISDEPMWRRVSISFNQRSLKAYLDDMRLINIPNITDYPTGVTIRGTNTSGGERNSLIKNIRIAKGAVPLYDRFLTDGKIITTGIRFDVNRSTIRPESMGTISEIVDLMKQHPELNFSVEGHTDSDGSEENNQVLSEARARAVVDQMIAMGIGADRLSHRGWGESKPIASNATAEGKAQNRRVEFVKWQ